MQSRKNSRNRKQSSRLQREQPPSTAVSYRGPLNIRSEQLDTTTILVDFPLSASASGVIQNVFSDVPLTFTSLASNFTAIYSEYRVLAMQVRFIPIVSGATVSTNAYNVIYIVWSANSDVTPLASYTVAAEYPAQTVRPINTTLQLTHKMIGLEESTFADTSNTTLIDYTFKLFASGLTNNALYGHVLIKYIIQFRGRK